MFCFRLLVGDVVDFRLTFISVARFVSFIRLIFPAIVFIMMFHPSLSLVAVVVVVLVGFILFFICLYVSFHFLCILGGSEELSYGFFPTSSAVFFVLNFFSFFSNHLLQSIIRLDYDVPCFAIRLLCSFQIRLSVSFRLVLILFVFV